LPLDIIPIEDFQYLTPEEQDEYYLTLLAEDYEQCENSFRCFLESSFREVLEPATHFIGGAHIDLICEHLELVADGQIKRLIINIPPRYMKSIGCTVCFPVWGWIHSPALRLSFVSYSGELSTDHSIKRRDILRSRWFLRKWGDRISFAEDQDRKTYYKNKEMGEMFSTSTGGAFTGKGGHGIIIDDALSPKLANSSAHREAANQFYDHTVSTRLDSKKHGFIVIIMQRLHTMDLVGHVLEKEKKRKIQELKSDYDFTVLSLEAVSEKKKTIIFPKSGRKWTREEGDLLWPEQEGRDEIEEQKINLGPYDFAAQYQQRPTPMGGGMVKREWWKRYEVLPDIKYKGWFLDTAVKDKQENDYTVALLLGVSEANYYIINVIRKRILAAELENFIDDIWAMNPANILSIEDKSSGQRLIQHLQTKRPYPVHCYKPEGDKVYRLSLATPYAHAGKVWVPQSAPWVNDFLDEFDQFPRGAHDDQVDAFTMGIISLTSILNVGKISAQMDHNSRRSSYQPKAPRRTGGLKW
jgi:predicted phage terminase large subunit-like protein